MVYFYPRVVFYLSLVSVGAFFVATAQGADEPPRPREAPVFQDAGPVAVSRERQFDFTSQINGGTYRVTVSVPPKADPNKTYPVLYVLDGNWYFRAMADTATWGSGTIPPMIVVGVGYPTEDYDEFRRRRLFDMTFTAKLPKFPPDKFGGADTFLRVLENEVKPFVAARYKIDPARQMIYGKSFGGLIVLRSLFRNPTAFSTYIASSPLIWWNGREVLADEPAFAARVKSGELRLRLLLISAGNEQYRGDDPAKLAELKVRGGLIDNVSELASRLTPLNPEHVQVFRMLIPDEGHSSSSLSSIGRAVRFAAALPPDEP